MFRSHGLVIGTSLLLSVGSLYAFNAQANDDATRLIQTAPDNRVWMTENQLNDFTRTIQESGRFGGFMDVTDYPNKVIATTPPYSFPGSSLLEQPPQHSALVQSLIKELSATRLLETVSKLSSYRNRYYQSESGLAAATWIKDQFETLARRRTDVEVQFFPHSFKQPSVIVRIQGKDAAKAHESVILGGHEDSISSSLGLPKPSALAPGADDNASGIATLLEVFRVIIETNFRPNRSLEFIAYAGEERGLLGSQAIAQSYRTKDRTVIGVLQLDMTLFPGTNGQISMVNDYVNRPLTQFTEALIDTYVKIPWNEITCGYACSDHAAWTEAGYAAAFPFEADLSNYNPHIHTGDDIPSYLDEKYGLNFAKLAVAFAVELSQ